MTFEVVDGIATAAHLPGADGRPAKTVPVPDAIAGPDSGTTTPAFGNLMNCYSDGTWLGLVGDRSDPEPVLPVEAGKGEPATRDDPDATTTTVASKGFVGFVVYNLAAPKPERIQISQNTDIYNLVGNESYVAVYDSDGVHLIWVDRPDEIMDYDLTGGRLVGLEALPVMAARGSDGSLESITVLKP
jgi:hypothetical protein